MLFNPNFFKLMLDRSLTNNIVKAINTLGIERTLETIEHLVNPILRAKLRQKYFEVLKSRKDEKENI